MTDVNMIDVNTKYMLDGVVHREDGPALIWADGDKIWYFNNRIHRDNGPAVERVNGEKKWVRHGKLHNKSGPAIIKPNGDQIWYFNDRIHRTDGPAVIRKETGYQMYCLSGIRLDKKEFQIIKWLESIKKYVFIFDYTHFNFFVSLGNKVNIFAPRVLKGLINKGWIKESALSKWNREESRLPNVYCPDSRYFRLTKVGRNLLEGKGT